LKLELRIGENCEMGTIMEAKSKLLFLSSLRGLEIEEHMEKNDDSLPNFIVDGSDLGDLPMEELERIIIQLLEQERLRLELESGYLYLVLEERPVVAFRMYRNMLDMGNEGQFFTRSNPQLLMAIDSLGQVYLTTENTHDGMENITPQKLDMMFDKMAYFMDVCPRGVIFIDSLGHLMSVNGFAKVLAMVQMMNEKIMSSNSICLVSLNPKSIPNDDFRMLQREFVILDQSSAFNPLRDSF